MTLLCGGNCGNANVVFVGLLGGGGGGANSLIMTYQANDVLFLYCFEVAWYYDGTSGTTLVLHRNTLPLKTLISHRWLRIFKSAQLEKFKNF